MARILAATTLAAMMSLASSIGNDEKGVRP
jgi:hypothetical protein